MNSTFKQALKAKAHHLKPVILMGAKGLTQALLEETNIALETHELIKVKVAGVEKLEKEQLATEMCNTLGAELVQKIGNILVLYRKRKDQ